MLSEDTEVAGRVTKIVAVSTDKAVLPYLVVRAASMEQTPAKTAGRPVDKVFLEVGCFHASYEGSVTLAEAVRSAIDNKRGEASGLTVRGCFLSDREELWESDAYVQALTFTILV